MSENPRARFLEQVRNPLVFFALALLIIEGVIGIVVATSNMSGELQFYSICVMAFLFFVVVIAVIVITIKWPRHLYEDIARQLEATSETTKQIKEFINSPAFRDTIEDVIISRVQPESLIRAQEEES